MAPGCSAGDIDPSSDWAAGSFAGRTISAGAYRLHTDLPAESTLPERSVEALQQSLPRYEALGGPLADRAEPMDVVLLSGPEAMARYIAETHIDIGRAQAYLRVRAGGFTERDCIVAMDQGDATIQTLRHEGWHQYAYRRHVRRLPAAIDEGIASGFEEVGPGDIRVSKANATAIRTNPRLAKVLERVIADNQLPDAITLLGMHAGDAIQSSRMDAETYYAGCWAIACTLTDSLEGTYGNPMQAMLRNAADGTLGNAVGMTAADTADPVRAAGIVRHYTGMSDEQFEQAYRGTAAHLSNAVTKAAADVPTPLAWLEVNPMRPKEVLVQWGLNR